MKLRNKNTGEIINALFIDTDFMSVDDLAHCPCDEVRYYHSLAELNEEWEDYKPKEPLIKDEKIRKAVRAWAEVNGITELRYDEYCGILDNNGGDVITFNDYRKLDFLSDHKIYTLTELCGDEE